MLSFFRVLQVTQITQHRRAAAESDPTGARSAVVASAPKLQETEVY
jgi:hypothetical protein